MSKWTLSGGKKELLSRMPRYLRSLWRRLSRPSILKRLEYSGEALPRMPRVNVTADVTEFAGSDEEILQQMRRAQSQIFTDIEPEHSVMIKINLNSANPYPASTDPAFLCWLVDLLTERGVKRILVGDCSSVLDLPTRCVMRKTGIESLLKGKASLVCFDQEEWVRVPIGGTYLNELIVPKRIYTVDRMIYLVNAKSHCSADFSMSMKHGVGLMHPYQRYDLHDNHLQEKVVEISLAARPDLIIMDARRVFMTGGPNEGEIYPAQRVFVGKELLAVDLAGYKLLYGIRRDHKTVGSFTEEPFAMRQFSCAKEMFGSKACE